MQQLEQSAISLDRQTAPARRPPAPLPPQRKSLYTPPAPIPQGEGVVQRIPSNWECGQGVAALAEGDEKKMDLVKHMLNGLNPPSLPAQLRIKITLDNQPGTNPAETNVNNGTGIITIAMRRWVATQYGVGFIMGIILHELGAHSLTDALMPQSIRDTENSHNPNNHVLNIAGRAYTITPAAGRPEAQQDHINAAKFDTANLDHSSPRALSYLNLMVQAGNSYIAATAVPPGGALTPVQTAVLTDVLETYLFDIARVVVDDDRNSVRGLSFGADGIAEVMNWLYGQITGPAVAGLAVQPVNNWLTTVALVPQTRWTVLGMLLNRLLGYLSP